MKLYIYALLGLISGCMLSGNVHFSLSLLVLFIVSN